MNSQTVTDVPVERTPSILLPPAALRLEHLELDPIGNPYYKFPPFLSPPEGVTLIPFEKFKARGIQIALDSDDELELDAEGIPTVELSVKHNTIEKDKGKKGRKKKTKKDDEPRKFSPWWDDWAEGEDLRRGTVFDQNIPRAERFSAGATDFAQNRKFSPALQSLYDHFRHFSGLLANIKPNNKYGKGSEGDEADDEDDEEELNAEQVAAEQEVKDNTNPQPSIDVDNEDDQARIYEDDDDGEKDFRIDTFLNDPEKSIQIFFSSFYKDKGLMWSESKRRDGPVLISFFLAFFVRNRIMPDYERAFVKAHRVADKARLELPQTAAISVSFPDVFGRACTAVWGEKRNDGWSSMDVDKAFPTSADPVPATNPESAFKPAPTSGPAAVQEWEAQMQERGLEKIEVDSFGQDSIANGWGEPMLDGPEGAGRWGDGATVPKDNFMNPWTATQNIDDWSGGESQPSLLHVLGPTTIPLTHDVQRAEKATRQIVAFLPPRIDGTGLERVLGTVVLAPWKKYCQETVIARPEILMECATATPFDQEQDLIRAFISPETVDVLREGMGLNGVFVQVAHSEIVNDQSQKSKSRGRTRRKAKEVNDKEWWFIEFVYEVIPSFWAEEGELE